MESEGDHYYLRNELKLDDALRSWRKDPVIEAVRNIGFRPKSVLEIGCGNGWRLRALAEHYKAVCCGIDPSKEAINAGRRFTPELGYPARIRPDRADQSQRFRPPLL